MGRCDSEKSREGCNGNLLLFYRSKAPCRAIRTPKRKITQSTYNRYANVFHVISYIKTKHTVIIWQEFTVPSFFRSVVFPTILLKHRVLGTILRVPGRVQGGSWISFLFLGSSPAMLRLLVRYHTLRWVILKVRSSARPPI